MNQALTHYGLLGVESDASDLEIKKAYRKFMRATHPDATQNTASQHLFVLIQGAYEVLSDPEKRAAYDQELAGGSTSAPNYDPGTSTPEPPPEPDWGHESAWEEPEPAPDYQKGEWEKKKEREYAEYLRKKNAPPAVNAVSKNKITQLINKFIGERFNEEEIITPDAPKSFWMVIALVATVVGHFGLFFVDPDGSMVLPLVLTFFVFFWLSARRFARKGKFGWLTVFSLVTLLIFNGAIHLIEQGKVAEGIPVLIAVTFALGGMIMLAAVWRARNTYTNGATRSLFSYENAQHRQFGNGILHTQDMYGNHKPVLETEATASVLDDISDIPGIRIAHGLVLPDGTPVQHAVIYGNKIALLNSVLWQKGEYAYSQSGKLTHFGHELKNQNVDTMPHAVKKMRHRFSRRSRAQVHGWTLLYSKSGEKTTLDTSYREDASGITLPEDGITEMFSWLFADKVEPIVSRRVMAETIDCVR